MQLRQHRHPGTDRTQGRRTFGAQTETVFLSDYDFKGCTGCEGCRKRTTCIVQDDMQLLYRKIFKADVMKLSLEAFGYRVVDEVKTSAPCWKPNTSYFLIIVFRLKHC